MYPETGRGQESPESSKAGHLDSSTVLRCSSCLSDALLTHLTVPVMSPDSGAQADPSSRLEEQR